MDLREHSRHHKSYVRISRFLYDCIERVRKAIANGRRRRGSATSAGKMCREEVSRGTPNLHVEMAELLKDPTATLLRIRSKSEHQEILSQPEWVVLGRYVQVAREGTLVDSPQPTRESFLQLMEAFRALLNLRVRRSWERDEYYLTRLPGSREGSDGDVEEIAELVNSLITDLREAKRRVLPRDVGQVLHVAIREEEYPSTQAIHGALAPFLPTFLRLATRGHWIAEHRPVRPRRTPFGVATAPVPPFICTRVSACGGDFQLTTLVLDNGDLSMSFEIVSREVVFITEIYPQIQELVTLLRELPVARNWNGRYFAGYTNGQDRVEEATRYYFRHRSHGIILGFPPDQWEALKGAFEQALGSPQIVPILTELRVQYGDV